MCREVGEYAVALLPQPVYLGVWHTEHEVYAVTRSLKPGLVVLER